eukprot:scaffold40526_cov71-Phaeocystis_antarctica.AAC.5
MMHWPIDSIPSMSATDAFFHSVPLACPSSSYSIVAGTRVLPSARRSATPSSVSQKRVPPPAVQ